jgi:O-6-methylguanine DNA methyltransferase
MTYSKGSPELSMTGEPSKKSSFKERVFDVVREIPKGATLSYGEVARRAGNPNAARAVGSVLCTNYDLNIPCHRVIHTDGTVGGYNRGVPRKKKLLLEESRAKKTKRKSTKYNKNVL